MDMDEN